MSAIGAACLARREDFAPVSAAKLLWQLERMGYVEEAFYIAFAAVVSGRSMQVCSRDDRQNGGIGSVLDGVSIVCNHVFVRVFPCILICIYLLQ